MPHNIEIKARIESVESFEQRVSELANEGPFEIIQDDTYFHCDTGRLKLRVISATEGELIFYRRENQQGLQKSSYIRTPTQYPEGLGETLSLAYGTIGRVQKNRTLYVIGRTRVHLDRVNSLGNFIEIEVVLEENERPEKGIYEATSLMDRLGVTLPQCIPVAYIDLLVLQDIRR